MVGENGTPDTPDWTLPPRTTAASFEDAALDMPATIELGEN